MTRVMLSIGREVFGERKIYDTFHDALVNYFTEDDVAPVLISQALEEHSVRESGE